jgi:drug/metabolite transporter (DMT)-like permease
MTTPAPSTVPSTMQDNRPLGVLLMLMGALAMSATDAAGKWAVQDYHVAQLNFVRGGFAVLILLPTVVKDGGLMAFRTARPAAHALRSLMLVVLAYSWFYSLTVIPLADATAIALCAPLCMTALSVVVLGDKVGPFRWAAVVVGFLGMVLIIRPGSDVFTPMALLPAFAAAGYATYMITNRVLRTTETVTAITLYPQIAVFLVSAAVSPFVWQPMTWGGFLSMAITGVCAGVGHLLLTYAFRYAPPSILAPLDYTALVWAIIFGVVLFDQLPDVTAVWGMTLIVAAGLVIIYRETAASRAAPSVPA